jgi:hypothetical protein
MWPPNAKLPRSAPAVLNGRCRARLDMSRSFLGVVLRGLSARGRSVTFPVWVIRRLHHQRMRARRPIKRPQLTLRHRHARFDWSHDHLVWTIRTWETGPLVWWNSFFAMSYRRSCKGLAQPQTVTPPPPKAVVLKMRLSWNEVFRWCQTLARPSVGHSKKRVSSDQWTRLHVRIVHPKWSCDRPH